MKIRNLMATKMVSLLLLAAGSASAQTITRSYNNLGTGDGSLNDISYDSWQFYAGPTPNGFPGARVDYTLRVEAPYNPADVVTYGGTQSWSRANFLFDAPVLAGHTLTKVEMMLYGNSVVNPNSSWNIYDQTGGWNAGNIVGSFNDLGTTPSWYTFDIPLSVLTTGFSFGTDIATNYPNPQSRMIFESEDSALGAWAQYAPQVVFTYVADPIPEPSAALVGSLGFLVLFRRRR